MDNFNCSLNRIYCGFFNFDICYRKKYSSAAILTYEDSVQVDRNVTVDRIYIERSVFVVKQNKYIDKLVKELKDNHNPNDQLIETQKRTAVVYTEKMLKEAINATFDKDNFTITFEVKTSSPNDSAIIANLMVETNGIMLKELASLALNNANYSGRYNIIADAKYDEVPVSPNVALNALVGLLLGALTGIVLCILIEKLDVRIRGEKDLLDKYNVPILGSIPVYEVINEVKK